MGPETLFGPQALTNRQSSSIWKQSWEIWVSASWGWVQGVQLPDLAKTNQQTGYLVCPMQYLGYTYTQKVFVLYLKSKFNWVYCLLSGNPKGQVNPPNPASLPLTHPAPHPLRAGMLSALLPSVVGLTGLLCLRPRHTGKQRGLLVLEGSGF